MFFDFNKKKALKQELEYLHDFGIDEIDQKYINNKAYQRELQDTYEYYCDNDSYQD